MAARKGSTGTSRGSSAKSSSKKSTASRKTSSGTSKKTTGSKSGKQTQRSTAKKSSGGAKRTAAEAGKNTADRSFGSAVRSEIGILTGLALTLFGTLSVFGLCGSAGTVIRNALFGIFGILAYVVPLLLFLAVMFFVSNLGNGKALGKLLAGLLIVPDLCGLIQLVATPYVKGEKLSEIYQAGTAGGWLGGAVKQSLCSVFDVVGAYLILVLILLICLVVITEKSVTRWLRAGGERFLGRARDDYEYRVEQNEENRIRNEQKKEELRIEREERRRQSEERRRQLEKEREETRARRTDHKVRGVEISENTVIGNRELPAESDGETEETIPGAIPAEKDEDAAGRNPAGNADAYQYEETEETENRETDEKKDSGETMEAAVGEEERFPEPEESAEDHTVEWWNPRETAEPLSGEATEQLERDLKSAGEETEPAERGEAEDIGGPEGVRRLDFMEERVNERLKEFETVKPDTGNDRAEKETSDTGNDRAETETSAAAKEEKKAAVAAKQETAPPIRKYQKPPTSLLNAGGKAERDSRAELNRVADKLQETLKRFGVNVTITDVSCGPSVTRYELLPEAGTRVNRITSLSDDIKLALAATDIRIEAPIPGKSAIGIEVPNKRRETVYLRDLIESGELKSQSSKIAFAAGKDIAGKVVVADIAKMPHMLIAGTTGSGKSVFTNSIIMTILFRATPEEVKLIIIDPKVVEFGIYNGIPHLMTPVVTDPRKAADALKWATAEMSRRYQTFANENVRDLKGYNRKIEREHLTDENGVPLKKLPQIVIIIDELADLMMVAAKDVEETICRLAQLARAAGIHLIIATQRPSVDVVTGLIKANIPSRVALLVSSGVDSRTIIDMNGAEKLLGNGDMLFAPSGYAKPVRLQGAFVSDEEVRRVVDYLKQQVPEGGSYDSTLLEEIETAETEEPAENRNERDELFADAARFLIEKKRASVSLLQRKFRIGFNRAARIIDQLEEAGVVGEEVGTKPRNVLMTEEEFEAYIASVHATQ